MHLKANTDWGPTLGPKPHTVQSQNRFNNSRHNSSEGWAADAPVTRSSCALMVSCFWQAGTDQSLTSPLQAAVAKVLPSGANWQAALGLSSASSLLWLMTCRDTDPGQSLQHHHFCALIASAVGILAVSTGRVTSSITALLHDLQTAQPGWGLAGQPHC